MSSVVACKCFAGIRFGLAVVGAGEPGVVFGEHNEQADGRPRGLPGDGHVEMGQTGLPRERQAQRLGAAAGEFLDGQRQGHR